MINLNTVFPSFGLVVVVFYVFVCFVALFGFLAVFTLFYLKFKINLYS